MLHLRFGYASEKKILKSKDVKGFFRVNFKPSWFEDPLVKKIVRSIDRSEIVGPYAVESPVLNLISNNDISGGAKIVILTLFLPEFEYDGSACGENCVKWFLEVAKRHDIHLAYAHLPKYQEPFEMKIVNTGVVISSKDELRRAYIDLDNHDGTYRMVV